MPPEVVDVADDGRCILADLDAPHSLAGGTPINRVSDTPKSPGFGCRETKTKLDKGDGG